MKSLSTYLLPLFLCVFILSGCSSGSTNPVATEKPGDDIALLAPDIDPSQTNRSLLGMWTASFDIETLLATVIPQRALNVHWNVTGLIPAPIIVVNYYDPANHIVNVDVTLSNPTQDAAYDVRLIIYTDDAGHMLLNEDNWTSLYDQAGGNFINPFIAYAKETENRIFDAQSQHTENLMIYLPSGNTEVIFAVDVSHGGNCEEPYLIENFRSGYLCSEPLSTALLEVDVIDWEKDTSIVTLHCPEITGVQMTPFSNVTGDVYSKRWKLNLVNETGAPAGEYPAIIFAYSEDSGLLALHDVVTIEIIDCDGLPGNPQLIASLKYLYACEDVTVKDDYAFVADDEEGLLVIDISNPDDPVIVNTTYLYKAKRLAIVDDYLYVAGDKLSIFDIQNPSSFALESSIAIHRTPTDLEVVDGYAYIATRALSLVIFDVTLPSDPHLTGEVNFTGSSNGVAVNGDYAYVAAGEIFIIISISDPYNPYVIDTIYNIATHYGNDLVFEDSQAYLATSIFEDSSPPGGVRSVSFSDPEVPQLLGGVDTLGNALDIVIQGDYAYVAEGEAGLTIVDISNPLSLTVVGNVDSARGTRIFVAGDMAYLLDFRRAVRVVDVSDKSNPTIVGHVLRMEALDIEIDNNTAFVAADYGGFISVDISDPFNPHLMDATPLFRATLVAIDDNFAYVSDGTDDWFFYVIDISNPSDLQLVGSTKLRGNGRAITIGDNIVYLLTNGYFYIIDVSNPFNPTVMSDTEIYGKDFDLKDQYALIALSNPGFAVYDVSNPYNPVNVNHLSTPEGWEIEISGNYAYVNIVDYFAILDITDPLAAVQIVGYMPMGRISDIEIQGNYAYLTNWYHTALLVVDVSDPANPSLFSLSDNDVTIEDIEVVDNYLYAAGGLEGGFMSFKLWD